jgi:protein-S-isoprenylcysteine O-methyltransferase Ste14
MGIGGSIFLLAIGAIIAFGVHVQVGWLDLRVVGWVLMLAGSVGLILTLWFWSTRRRRVVVVPPPQGEVVDADNWAQGAPPPAETVTRTTRSRFRRGGTARPPA